MMALPEILGRDPEGATLFLDPGHAAFQGHFPGDPVLPGVVQVDWAVRLGEEAFGPQGTFAGLSQVKFLEAMRPGETVNLRLGRTRPGTLTFTYLSGGTRKSSGSILFLAEP